MRPAEFSNEIIVQAGRSLLDEGRNITGFALRQKVGGGNPQRLKQVWDEYLASQQNEVVEPAIELPVELAEAVTAATTALTEQILKLATDMNTRAVKAAERRVAEVVRTAGEQREQTERELADAIQAVDELEEQIEQAREDLQRTTGKLEAQLEQSQRQAIEIAQLRERLAAQEREAKTAQAQHQAELAKAEEEVQDLANELQQVRQQAAAEAERLRKEAATLEARMNAMQEGFNDHKKQMATEAHRCSEKLIAAQKDRDQARKEAVEARETLARQAGKMDALEAQNKELVAAFREGKK